jgi:hypothetical protein
MEVRALELCWVWGQSKIVLKSSNLENLGGEWEGSEGGNERRSQAITERRQRHV